jgi:hypothetical protein
MNSGLRTAARGFKGKRSGLRLSGIALLLAAVPVLLGQNCGAPPVGGDDDDAVEPLFPANYRTTFNMLEYGASGDCRFGVEHAATFRVWINDLGLEGYRNNATELPIGTIVIKEEFGGNSCDDPGDLDQWRVMRKDRQGADPGSWSWQRVLANRSVVENTNTSCISCHEASACVERDYMCTEE